MNNFDFAMSVIRAPWLTRLKDRTFLSTISAALTAGGAAIAIWNTDGVPIGDKVNATIAAIVAIGGVVATFTHGNQKKDAAVITAALQSTTPETINPGGDVQVGSNMPAASQTGQTLPGLIASAPLMTSPETMSGTDLVAAAQRAQVQQATESVDVDLPAPTEWGAE